MIEQLSLIPSINEEETKENVEEALVKYREFMFSVSEEKLPKVTATYSLVSAAPSNLFNSTTESVAIDRVHLEQIKESHINWIRKGVNRLNAREREIIIKRYLIDDMMYDYQIYTEMNLSERQYYRMKSKAFFKLAAALKIESYI